MSKPLAQSITVSLLFLSLTVLLLSQTVAGDERLRTNQVVVLSDVRTIAPGGMENFHTNFTATETPTAMTGFTVRLVSADDPDIELTQSQVYIHHLVIFTKKEVDIVCPEHGKGEFIAGVGAEQTDIFLPEPYGVMFRANETWSINNDIMNPSTKESIAYRIKTTYYLTEDLDDVIIVKGYFNSITGCNGDDSLEFDVPNTLPETTYNLFLDFPSSITGDFVWIAAHLHRGAKSMYFVNKDTGDMLFSARAHYSDVEHPDYIISIDSLSANFSVSQNDNLRMSTTYDGTVAHDGVMAIIFGYAVVKAEYNGDPPLKQYTGSGNVFSDAPTGNVVGSGDNVPIFATLTVVAIGVMVLVVIVLVAGFIVVRRLRARNIEIHGETEANDQL